MRNSAGSNAARPNAARGAVDCGAGSGAGTVFCAGSGAGTVFCAGSGAGTVFCAGSGADAGSAIIDSALLVNGSCVACRNDGSCACACALLSVFAARAALAASHTAKSALPSSVACDGMPSVARTLVIKAALSSSGIQSSAPAPLSLVFTCFAVNPSAKSDSMSAVMPFLSARSLSN